MTDGVPPGAGSAGGGPAGGSPAGRGSDGGRSRVRVPREGFSGGPVVIGTAEASTELIGGIGRGTVSGCREVLGAELSTDVFHSLLIIFLNGKIPR